MSYGEGNGGARGKALTGGVVALIQAGIVVALVSGLAVTMSPPKPPPHMPTQIFPTAPMPTQDVKPVKTPEKSQITAHPMISDPIVRTSESTFTAPVPQPLPSFSGVDRGEPSFAPSAAPSAEPTARFTAKGAMPRGDMARWVTTEDYPTADVRQRHTGAVRFRLALDAGGKVSGCSVTQSSGYESLDAATCRLITRRARFDPARDASGNVATGTYEGTIRWVIPQD